MRKIKKLINNPNRFFFDYFAKRLGSNQVNNVAPKAPVNRGVSSYLSPANFTFDKNVHPWTQVAEAFDLRTGATSGHPDQSLLVNSTDHLSVLMYACWLTHAFNYSLKVYTLGGAISQEIKGLDLLNIGKVEGLYKKLHTKSDYVLEMSGTFDNNFALHIFLYDIKDELYEVRARNAFVKKIKRESFNEIYPAPINNFGQYEFGTPWPVDIVYTWVNKDDLDWVSLWNSNFPETPFDPDRFSSKDELKYSLRSICKFLPWFNTIYIVSNCKKPDWLVEHPKLKWVDHQDIFPDQNALPTFNSHAIEACLHKIDGLNERFIYLNDDMFVNSPSYYADFYDPLGRTIAHFEPYGMVYDNNIFDDTKDYLSPSINCQRLIKNVFPFYTATQLHKHSPYALRKSVMDEIETLFRQNFNTTRAAKLRTADDINVTSFLYHHYGLASGKTICSEFSYLIVRPRNIRTIAGSQARTFKYLCFNDGDGSSEDKKYIEQYFKLVNNLYPCPSPFEQECKQWNSIKISKTIMAYYTREHRIPEIRKKIGDAKVSLDIGQWGLWENSRRSWLSFSENADFHLMIQDDAIVCDDFYKQLSSVFEKKHPSENKFVYCLYFRLKKENKEVFKTFNESARNSIQEGGFDDDSLRYGIAYIVPTSKVKEMVSFADNLDHLGNADDTRYSRFFQSQEIKVHYPLPSLIDQNPDEISTHNGNTNKLLGATWFVDRNNSSDITK